jgi:hypothetical protein
MVRWMNLRRFGNPCSKDNWTNYADWNYEKITLLKNIHNITNSSFLRENHRWFWTLSKTRGSFFLMKIIFDWQGTFGLFWDQSKIIWFWNIKRIHWMNHVRDGAIYEQFCTKVCSEKKWQTFVFCHFITISGHFFANYTNIFHKI